MYKRARSTSYGDYNQVSQSQGFSNMYRPYSKSSNKNPRTYLPSKKKDKKSQLAKKINSAISRRIENKVFVGYGSNLSIPTAGTTLAPVYQNLLPVLSQGLGQSGRIGNNIKIRSAVLTLAVNTTQFGTSATGLPSYVRFWLVSSKVSNGTTLTTTQFNNFFQLGNTDADFQSNMLDVLFPVNNDEWTVYHDQTVKVGMTSGSNVNNVQYDNSDASIITKIDWGSNFKSAIQYEDTSTSPTNRNLFLILQWVRADGTQLTQGDTTCEYHYTNVVKYEDA